MYYHKGHLLHGITTGNYLERILPFFAVKLSTAVIMPIDLYVPSHVITLKKVIVNVNRPIRSKKFS